MNEIGFIPETTRKQQLQKQLIVKLALVFLTIFFLIRIAFYYPASELKRLREYKMLNAKKYSQLEKDNAKLNANLDKRSSAIDVINLQNKKLGSAFKSFERFLIPGIMVKDIKVDYTGMSLNGNCQDYFSIIKFVSKLEKSRDYKKVKISNINYNKDSSLYSYNINFTPWE